MKVRIQQTIEFRKHEVQVLKKMAEEWQNMTEEEREKNEVAPV